MSDRSAFATLGPYHILSYGTLLGSTIFQSFIGGVIAYKSLPRPQFATLQSATFPVFFAMQTALPIVIGATYPGSTSLLGGNTTSSIAGVLDPQNRWSVLLPLGLTFVVAAANTFVLGPETTKTMRLRKHQETRDGKKYTDPAPHSAEMQRLNKRFGMLHGTSSLINFFGLIATIAYGFTLGARLQ